MNDRDRLFAMVVEAHDAMLSEAMACPWCGTGYISAQREEHEAGCLWLVVQDEAKRKPS